jgi:tRNA pseudouridine55 synthase
MNSSCILLNKHSGVTSFDALKPIKTALNTGKVGHTGTLDKFARGLLIVLTGRALKLSQWFLHSDKKYIADVLFGSETDTLDPEGSVVASAPPPSLSDLEKILPNFTGTIMQSPPLYSAVHINGRRAYEIARSGESAEIKTRPVTIYSLELLSYEPPLAKIAVHCSSGTYIRSLARDIALAINSCAHLSALLRTNIGKFSVTDAVDSDCKIKMLPIDKTIFENINIPSLEVDKITASAIKNGRQSLLKMTGTYAVFCEDEFIKVITL